MTEPTILVQFGHKMEMVALCRREDPDEDLNDLCWRTATAERVAADIETPPAAVGTLVDVPILVSGIDTFLADRITVAEAIDRLAAFMAEQDRETLHELHKRENDPERVMRNVELYGTTVPPVGEFRDPESITHEECCERAAEAIIRASIDAVLGFDTETARLGELGRFFAEIEAAGAVYPYVLVELLYDAGREQQGWLA